MPIAKKAMDRISEGVKRYRTILAQAKKRDVSESDTVVIIGDMLADVLGYEKYVEVSTEFAVKGTYVDLAVKVGKEVYFLVEAKAIGVELKDTHVRQVVDYGANQGVEWAVVTNGVIWRVYRIEFKKPISHSLIAEVNLLEAGRDADVVEFFSNLCKEGFAKSQMEEFYEQHQATNSHTLAAVLLSDSMLNHLRLGLRRLFPDVTVDAKSLGSSLRNEVLKRELVEGEDCVAAAALVRKVTRTAARRKKAGKMLLVPPAPNPSAAPALPAAAAALPTTAAKP